MDSPDKSGQADIEITEEMVQAAMKVVEGEPTWDLGAGHSVADIQVMMPRILDAALSQRFVKLPD